MEYIPHHERLAREQENLRLTGVASVEKKRELVRQVADSLGRLTIPASRQIYIEVLKPANSLEQRFRKDLIHRQEPVGRGKFSYQWKVDDMTPGLVLPKALVYYIDTFVDDMRTPSGTKRIAADMLLAQDGRIWPAENPVATSTYQVIGSRAIRHESLISEALEQMVEQLDI